MQEELDLINKKLDVLLKDKAVTSIYVMILLGTISVLSAGFLSMTMAKYKFKEGKNQGLLLISVLLIIVILMLLVKRINP